MEEIKVTLHAAFGDVVTSFPANMVKDALALAASYVAEHKMFTLEYK